MQYHNRYAIANIIWILSVSMVTLAYGSSGKQGFKSFFEKGFCSDVIFPLAHTFSPLYFGFFLGLVFFLEKDVMAITGPENRFCLLLQLNGQWIENLRKQGNLQQALTNISSTKRNIPSWRGI